LKDDNDILNAVLSQLGDSYEYKKSLGEGTTSRVYLVYQKHLKQYRALKIMDYEYIHHSLVKGKVADSIKEFKIRRKRFINEAEAYKKIKNRNVAEIYDIRMVKIQRESEVVEIPYIIMQYVDGEPLSYLLKSKKPLKLEIAAAISVDILDAIAAIHQKKIIHRDIKPANIMIEKGTGNAIIIDFGLAKDMIDGTRMTSTGMPMGTKLYMSPEQFKDSSKVGPGTDIYSFGVILYEMLAGKPPYEGTEVDLMYKHISGEIPDIKKENKNLPGVMDTLIRKALSKEEKNRETPQYYKEELESFINKPGTEEVEPNKKSDLVFKPRYMNRFAYAAVFIFIVMISYFLYFYLNPKSSGIIKDRDLDTQRGTGVRNNEISAGGLKQPDPVYYGLKRDELLKCSKIQIIMFSIPWVAASAREGTIIYKDSSLAGGGFKTAYLQRFAVLDKIGDKLKLKELGKPNPGTGWTSMKNLIYLSSALKDERTLVYQKVVFSHIDDHIYPGKIGDITFYKSPGSYRSVNILETRALGTLRIAYVYAWENSDYEDSPSVLIGNYPSIESPSKDENAFKKTLYGWCKTAKIFPWNSRMALIPNKEKNARAYIFTNGPDLKNFYSQVEVTSVPDPEDLLTTDSYKLWQDSNWPFFLEGKITLDNQKFLRLICQVDARHANVPGFSNGMDVLRQKQAYIMKFGYAVEKDPRFPHINQFKNVYLFRKSEINKITYNLVRTLELLRPSKIEGLCKYLIERIYGDEYDPKRTINKYSQIYDGIIYKELSVLFDKTQEQIDKLDSNEIYKIVGKTYAVKARLEDILNDKAGERFFGPLEDPYVWLYEEELP
jgi:serine/threonine protein kinase